MIHRSLRSGGGGSVSRSRPEAFPLRLAIALVTALAAGCATDDRYAQCEPASGDCGTYEIDDETWEYACVTVETAVTSGSFCTRECTNSCATIAGYEGVCFRFSAGEDRFCYQRCERDEDCYPSSRCVDALRDDGWRGRLCMPDQP